MINNVQRIKREYMKGKFLTSVKQQKKPNILQIFGSVAAAAFGVQSRENRERDFKKGKFSTFVIGGIIFTVLFVISVFFIVNTVLESAS